MTIVKKKLSVIAFILALALLICSCPLTSLAESDVPVFDSATGTNAAVGAMLGGVRYQDGGSVSVASKTSAEFTDLTLGDRWTLQFDATYSPVAYAGFGIQLGAVQVTKNDVTATGYPVFYFDDSGADSGSEGRGLFALNNLTAESVGVNYGVFGSNCGAVITDPSQSTFTYTLSYNAGIVTLWQGETRYYSNYNIFEYTNGNNHTIDGSTMQLSLAFSAVTPTTVSNIKIWGDVSNASSQTADLGVYSYSTGASRQLSYYRRYNAGDSVHLAVNSDLTFEEIEPGSSFTVQFDAQTDTANGWGGFAIAFGNVDMVNSSGVHTSVPTIVEFDDAGTSANGRGFFGLDYLPRTDIGTTGGTFGFTGTVAKPSSGVHTYLLSYEDGVISLWQDSTQLLNKYNIFGFTRTDKDVDHLDAETMVTSVSIITRIGVTVSNIAVWGDTVADRNAADGAYLYSATEGNRDTLGAENQKNLNNSGVSYRFRNVSYLGGKYVYSLNWMSSAIPWDSIFFVAQGVSDGQLYYIGIDYRTTTAKALVAVPAYAGVSDVIYLDGRWASSDLANADETVNHVFAYDNGVISVYRNGVIDQKFANYDLSQTFTRMTGGLVSEGSTMSFTEIEPFTGFAVLNGGLTYVSDVSIFGDGVANTVSIAPCGSGMVTVPSDFDWENLAPGAKVYVEAVPDEGCYVSAGTLRYTLDDGTVRYIANFEDGKYYFRLPADSTVTLGCNFVNGETCSITTAAIGTSLRYKSGSADSFDGLRFLIRMYLPDTSDVQGSVTVRYNGADYTLSDYGSIITTKAIYDERSVSDPGWMRLENVSDESLKQSSAYNGNVFAVEDSFIDYTVVMLTEDASREFVTRGYAVLTPVDSGETVTLYTDVFGDSIATVMGRMN